MKTAVKSPAKRNITIELDESVILQVKLVAARRSVSVSQLLRDQVAALAKQDDSYELAKQRAIAAFPKASKTNAVFKPYPSRESIYDR